MKIASIGVVAGAITAEFLGGGTGFGHLIRTAASQLETPRVFALIIYLSLLGLATFWTVVLAAAAARLLAEDVAYLRTGRLGDTLRAGLGRHLAFEARRCPLRRVGFLSLPERGDGKLSGIALLDSSRMRRRFW